MHLLTMFFCKTFNASMDQFDRVYLEGIKQFRPPRDGRGLKDSIILTSGKGKRLGIVWDAVNIRSNVLYYIEVTLNVKVRRCTKIRHYGAQQICDATFADSSLGLQ